MAAAARAWSWRARVLHVTLAVARVPAARAAAAASAVATAGGWPRLRPPRSAALLCTTSGSKLSAAAQAVAAAAAAGGPVERKPIGEHTKRQVAYDQKYVCARCACLLPPNFEVDHRIPVALGGSNGRSNLQALCRPCHAQKTRDQRWTILEAARKRKLEGITAAEAEAIAVDANAAVVGSAVAAAPRSAAELAAGEDVLSRSRQAAALPGSSALLDGLNAQQLLAVRSTARAIRVVAGPGCGKTRVLTTRVAELVRARGVPAKSVLALTFTNRAANELRTRLAEQLGPEAAEQVSVGTFHGICLAILRADIELLNGADGGGGGRDGGAGGASGEGGAGAAFAYRRGFAVYDQADTVKTVGQCIAQLGLDKKQLKPTAVQSAISFAKNQMLDPGGYAALADADARVAAVYELYDRTLRARNVVDFDDMLLLTRTLLRSSSAARARYRARWRAILIDEFQDTNRPQYEIVELLAAPRHAGSAGAAPAAVAPTGAKGEALASVFVVGDSDQAIYGWRGADWRNQQRFDIDFNSEEQADDGAAPGAPRGEGAAPHSDAYARFVLELNYRSSQRVLDAAMRLMRAARCRSAAQREGGEDGAAGSRDGTRALPMPYDELSLQAAGPAARLSLREAPVPTIVALRNQDAEAAWVADVISRLRDGAGGAAAGANSAVAGGEGGQTPRTRARRPQRPPSIAILYRTNAQSRALERALIREGIPHQLVHATPFFERREVRDALAYLALCHGDDGHAEELALERVLNVPPRAIGAGTVEKLRAWARGADTSLWQAVAAAARDASASGSGAGGGGERGGGERGGGSGSACADGADGEGVLLSSGPALSPRAAKALHGFHELVLSLKLEAARAGSPGSSGDSPPASSERTCAIAQLLLRCVRDSGYEDWLRNEQADGEARWQNIRELANLATSLKASSLLDFLDKVALIQDQDMLTANSTASNTREEGATAGGKAAGGAAAAGAVKLMTLHASKGLEFDVVFVVGVEEDLLPHHYSVEQEGSAGNEDAIDEERRLLYVAMTRARRHLYLCHTRDRLVWGTWHRARKSRFLDDIPPELCAGIDVAAIERSLMSEGVGEAARASLK